jgi:drug/metabolite transporter (DMT)-like permease
MTVLLPPSVTPDLLWGAGLALLAMATFGSCMVGVSFLMRSLGSGPGSMLAAAAGVPVGLALAAGQLAFGGGVAMPSVRVVLLFAAAGVLSTYLGRWLVFESIGLLGPSRAAALQCVSPLFTALFGWLFLDQLLGPLGMLGIAIGIAGLVAMSLGGQAQPARDGTRVAARQGGFVFASLLVGLASAAAYAGSHITRAVGVHDWNEPLLGATIGAVAGLATLMVASRKQLGGYLREIAAHRFGAAVYLGVGTLQFLAQALVIASMKYIPAAVAGLISMATPLVVMPISYFVLRKQENLTPAVVLGIVVTVSGIALVVLYGHPAA